MNTITLVTLISFCFNMDILCTEVVSESMNKGIDVNSLNHPEVDVLILGAGYAGIGKFKNNFR